jgi:hypothetical protein
VALGFTAVVDLKHVLNAQLVIVAPTMPPTLPSSAVRALLQLPDRCPASSVAVWTSLSTVNR